MALAGERAIPGEPVRKGTSKAKIKLDMGALVVERTFTAAGGTSIKVTEDGEPRRSPQTILDALFAKLTFDPFQFSRMAGKDQLAELRRIVPLSVDLAALDTANKNDYDRRTDLNRDIKSLRAQADAIDVPPGTPELAVDESAFLDGITEAAAFNALIEKRKATRAMAGAKISDFGNTVLLCCDRMRAATDRAAAEIAAIKERLQRELAELESAKTQAIAEAEALQAKLDAAAPLPEPINVAQQREELNKARETNASVEKRKRRDALRAEIASLESDAWACTARMADRDKQKQDALIAAKMPVPGLGFGSDHITYNGLPFDQASSAVQLRVSAAIAMAGNPTLRILRIKDGGLLDDKSLEMLRQMAENKDYQIWLESVRSDDPTAVIMEAGEIRPGEIRQ
jgi:cell division protein FtsB